MLEDLFGITDFFDDIESERSDTFESMRRELDRDRRQMQQQWRREQQVHRHDVAQRIDDLEQKMRAIQDARDESEDGLVDLGEYFETLWDGLQDDRERLGMPRSTPERPRPRYTYDPENRKVRLAYERVNWQKEGF